MPICFHLVRINPAGSLTVSDCDYEGDFKDVFGKIAATKWVGTELNRSDLSRCENRFL